MTEKNFELLTADTNDRFCLFPIKYNDIWQMYKKHEATMWTAEEIDMSVDKREWKTLSPPEKQFIINILAFFANSDSIVLENLITNFCKEIPFQKRVVFMVFKQ